MAPLVPTAARGYAVGASAGACVPAAASNSARDPCRASTTPRVGQAGRAAECRYVQRVDIAPRGQVEPDPLEDRAHRVQRLEFDWAQPDIHTDQPHSRPPG